MALFSTHRNADNADHDGRAALCALSSFCFLSPSLLSSLHPLISRQKKAATGHEEGDYENLVNRVSERQTHSAPAYLSLARGTESSSSYAGSVRRQHRPASRALNYF